MRILLYVIVFLFLSFSCNRERDVRSRETREKQFFIAALYNLMFSSTYACPAYTVLSPGDTTISLKEGQEYWFDFTPRISTITGNTQVYFTIVYKHSQNQVIGSTGVGCYVEGPSYLYPPGYVQPSPTTFRTPENTSQGNTKIYLYGSPIRKQGEGLIFLKSISGLGSITITIPASETIFN